MNNAEKIKLAKLALPNASNREILKSVRIANWTQKNLSTLKIMHEAFKKDTNDNPTLIQFAVGVYMSNKNFPKEYGNAFRLRKMLDEVAVLN